MYTGLFTRTRILDRVNENREPVALSSDLLRSRGAALLGDSLGKGRRADELGFESRVVQGNHAVNLNE